MALETLMLGSLASYGIYRKSKDLEERYSQLYMGNYPYYGEVNLNRIFFTFKTSSLWITSALLKSTSFGLLYYTLYSFLD